MVLLWPNWCQKAFKRLTNKTLSTKIALRQNVTLSDKSIRYFDANSEYGNRRLSKVRTAVLFWSRWKRWQACSRLPTSISRRAPPEKLLRNGVSRYFDANSGYWYRKQNDSTWKMEVDVLTAMRSKLGRKQSIRPNKNQTYLMIKR